MFTHTHTDTHTHTHTRTHTHTCTHAHTHTHACTHTQLLLGTPFLLHAPISYMQGAFNFGRQFLYQWTVNWRFLPEWMFLHRALHISLLAAHCITLMAFTLSHWTKYVTDRADVV